MDVAPGSAFSDTRSVGVTFPAPGAFLVRGGASTDGVNWTYSDPMPVTVLDCITVHTVNTQAIPKPGLEKWFRPSHVVSKSFQVLHTNPYP